MNQPTISIAIDAMGGDNSPSKVIEGCEIFLNDNNNVKLFIFGDTNSFNNHLKIIQTAEEILDLSSKFLIKSGNLIIKIYQGSREKDFVLKLKENFMKVSYFKPQSSRKSSPEIYLVALNYQLG